MPEPAKSESVPPVTSISVKTKLLEDSVRVKVMAAVSPALRVETLEESSILGGVVSSMKLRPKLVIRASVIELAPTERTSKALFSNSSSILLKSSDAV